MKKLFAIIAVAAFVFAACGPKAETPAEPEATEPQQETVVPQEEVTPDTTAVPTEEVAPVE